MTKREHTNDIVKMNRQIFANDEKIPSGTVIAPVPCVQAQMTTVIMTNEITKIPQKSCTELIVGKEYKIVAMELLQTFYGAKAVTTCVDIMQNKPEKFTVHLTPYFAIHYLELDDFWKKYQPNLFLCLYKLDEERNQKFPVYHISALKGYDEVDFKANNEPSGFSRTLLMIGYFVDIEKYSIPDIFKSYCIPDGPNKSYVDDGKSE